MNCSVSILKLILSLGKEFLACCASALEPEASERRREATDVLLRFLRSSCSVPQLLNSTLLSLHLVYYIEELHTEGVYLCSLPTPPR